MNSESEESAKRNLEVSSFTFKYLKYVKNDN